jgi:PAS domain S-box-containing protein
MTGEDTGAPSPSGAASEHDERKTLAGLTAAWQEASTALQDSERRYRELVEYSLGLICTHDLSGVILSINPAAATSLGYRPGDGIGHNLREFLSPDTRHLFDDYLTRIRDRGDDAGLMRVVSRDGGEKVWMYRNVLSRDPAGVSYVLGHAIDITERVAVERTLREREQALRAAHAELESRVTARTSELQTANERLHREIADREKAERSRERALIEQRDVLAFLANFSDRLAPLVSFEQLLEVIRRLPVPFLADWTLLHLVGEDGSISLPTPPSTPGSVTVSPSALGRVIATGDIAIIAVDEHPGEQARSAALLPLVMDGRVAAVLTLASAIDGRFEGSGLLIVEDITRRIRLALDRIQLYREAQEANRLKDEFLSTLSHELRTPLNAIFGWAKILQGRDLDASTAHAVEVIRRNAEAQTKLIEEVLDVSRIITGKMALADEPLDVAAIVRATIDTVRPTLHAKRIRLTERIDKVATVTGDSHRLQQAFWNVMSNALKFTEKGGSISITVRQGEDSVEIEVADTGAGIRRDMLPFVFDRFRQADSSTTRRHGGLGLGLAIVRHVVELHGGSVRAASPGEGHGSTFTIRLPIADQVSEASAPSAVPDAVGRLLAGGLEERTILVVEDDDDARELIAAVLRAAGARVITAATTQQGLDRVRFVRPDALVADLGLPLEDGYTLLARFRKVYPDVPAFALTAYARASDRERVLAAGFQRHLIKPMDPKVLVDDLVSILSEAPET